MNFTLQDYQQQGYFDSVVPKADKSDECELKRLYDNNQIAEFLQLAIERKKNIIVSGATGSGKTTFARSLLQLVPQTNG